MTKLIITLILFLPLLIMAICIIMKDKKIRENFEKLNVGDNIYIYSEKLSSKVGHQVYVPGQVTEIYYLPTPYSINGEENKYAKVKTDNNMYVIELYHATRKLAIIK